MEKVSVIIPTYNRASLLERAIQSVLQQKGFAGELLIVDDGSTDETAEVVNDISSPDNIQIRYHRRISNCGPASARNFGVSVAKHPLIAFLDSDDHWFPDKMKRQLEVLQKNPEFRICHTGEKWLRRGVHLNQKNIHKPRHGDIFAHCLKLCAVGMSTVVIYKSLFIECGGFDTSLPCCEDYDLWIRLSCYHKFLLLPDPLIVKEGGRVDQLSHMYRVGMDQYRIYALEKLIQNESLQREQLQLAINELTEKCRVYGSGCIKHGQAERGRRYLSIPEKYKKLI
jgi:glycosyltransferase involved in cell wall biosynthesis